ncbi:radical SAM protein [Slackia heliotrinireducens]|uniref:radical SAM protein n=1 Tax=Slackia heliotrinireducens TaxID=84110 RepID=UPI003314DC9B
MAGSKSKKRSKKSRGTASRPTPRRQQLTPATTVAHIPLELPEPAPDNPPLNEWIVRYLTIYQEYLIGAANKGVEFGEPYQHDDACREVKERLREKGVTFRNGEASIVYGDISTACIACTGGDSQSFFYSLRCPKNCFFCFNHNQNNYAGYLDDDRDWRSELAAIMEAGRPMTHLALTGGEPLMRPDEACAFFEIARANWPDAHLRLYTSGEGLTRELMGRLVAAGMNEIRFSIKLDVDTILTPQDFELIRMSCEFPVSTMVEMPVMPGTFGQMTGILRELDALGAFGINLLEFCYAEHNWPEFAKRGFKVKNPPFTVLYDWGYAGSHPIEGSDLECLRLLEYAADQGLRLGVHYCSLENKHRDQVYQMNHMAPFSNPCFAMDDGDFYWKTCKVFGVDVAPARRLLESLDSGGRLWKYDAEDDCLLFNPQLQNHVLELPVRVMTSANILVKHPEGVMLRELGLFD